MTEKEQKRRESLSKGQDTPTPSVDDRRSSIEDEPFKTIAERYHLKQKVGQGGMGTVFRARDSILKRDVAIKLPNRKICDETFLRRFQQEARAASQLNHPNIMRVLDFGLVSAAQPYMVMEWVDGETLDKKIKRERKVRPDEAVNIILQIAQGLEHAHQNGIIHRDIKPSNIMLTSAERGLQALVLDFGIAKMADATADGTLTNAGQVVGSPHYLSPEQARCAALDSRSDVYSLGCVMFEMLTSEPPFTGDSALETIGMHISEKAPELSSIIPDISKTLEEIVCKTLEKDPERRFASMSALSEALQKYLDEKAADEPHSQTLVQETQTNPEKPSTISNTRRMKVITGTLIATGFICVFSILYLELLNTRPAQVANQARPQNPRANVTRTSELPETSLSEIAPPDLPVNAIIGAQYRTVRNQDSAEILEVNSEHHGDSPSNLDNAIKSGKKPIRHLRIYEMAVSPQLLDVIERHKCVTELRFQNCKMSEETQCRIAKIKRLTELKFVKMPVSAKTLDLLRQSTSLNNLQIYSTKLPDGALKAIAGIKNIKILELNKCENIESDSLRELTKLKRLERLRLEYCNLGDAAIASIASMRNLKLLSLSGNGPFTPVQLRKLAELPHLNELFMAKTGANIKTMQALSTLERLALLDVSDNPGVDIGSLQHFAGRKMRMIVVRTGIPQVKLKVISSQLGGLNLGTDAWSRASEMGESINTLSGRLD